MSIFRPLTIVALACAGLTALPAAAQDVVAPPDAALPAQELDIGGDTVTIGIGGAYLPDYEGSNDYQLLPVPGAVGSIGGYGFTVLGNRASLDIIRNRPDTSWDIQFGPVGLVNFMRSNRQGIDDPRVRRLGERSTAIEVGGYFGIGKTGVITSAYDKLSISVSYRHDVSGVHKSGIWQPTINYLTPLSRKAAVGVFASAERVERDFVTTYYNVGPVASVNSGLPEFRGRGGWKGYTLGALGTVALTGDLLKGFKIVGGGTYRRLLNDIGDSPLVSIAGSRNQWLGVLGLAYTF